MDQVPTDILYLIFSYLIPKVLVACSRVSKHWYQLANSDRLWGRFVTSILFPSSYKVNYQYKFIEDDLVSGLRIKLENNENIYQQTCISSISRNIYEIPKTIGLLCNLSSLCLNYNFITVLPKEIASLSSLTELELRNNNIRNLPKELVLLTNLQRLSLDNNKIKVLHSNIIPNLTRLVDLSLMNNKITVLPDNFTRLNNLKFLDLDFNRLSIFPGEILEKLPNLSMVSVVGNRFDDTMVKPLPNVYMTSAH